MTDIGNAVLRAAMISDAYTTDDPSGCRVWTAVAAASARVGWVCAADTRPMVGLYYAFERLDDEWRLTALLAVDAAR